MGCCHSCRAALALHRNLLCIPDQPHLHLAWNQHGYLGTECQGFLACGTFQHLIIWLLLQWWLVKNKVRSSNDTVLKSLTKKKCNRDTGEVKLTLSNEAQSEEAISFQCHQSHATGCLDTSSDVVFWITTLEEEGHKLQSLSIICPSVRDIFTLPVPDLFSLLSSRKPACLLSLTPVLPDSVPACWGNKNGFYPSVASHLGPILKMWLDAVSIK